MVRRRSGSNAGHLASTSRCERRWRRLGSRSAAETLRIRDAGKRQILREGVERPERPIQQVQFALQGVATALGQGLDQVLGHRAHSSRNLKILSAVEPYLAVGELHEVIPVRRAKNHPETPRLVENGVVVQ